MLLLLFVFTLEYVCCVISESYLLVCSVAVAVFWIEHSITRVVSTNWNDRLIVRQHLSVIIMRLENIAFVSVRGIIIISILETAVVRLAKPIITRVHNDTSLE